MRCNQSEKKAKQNKTKQNKKTPIKQNIYSEEFVFKEGPKKYMHSSKSASFQANKEIFQALF